MSEAEDPEVLSLQKRTPDVQTIAPPDSEDAKQQKDLEDRRVAEPSILGERMWLDEDLTKVVNDEKIDVPCSQPVKAATVMKGAPDSEDSSKLPERGIHSLKQSVTDEVSRPISEVDDDLDPGEVSTEYSIHRSHTATEQKSRNPQDEKQDFAHRSDPTEDDFEGADGSIDSESGGQSQEPHAEVLRRRILSLNKIPREGHDKEAKTLSHELQAEPRESQSHSGAGFRHSQQADSEGVKSSSQKNSQQEKLNSDDTEVDAVSYLGMLSTEPQEDDEQSAQQPRLESETSVYYPQQLHPEDIVNPFSLEDRIRKAREHQTLSLDWEADNFSDARLFTGFVADDSQSQSNLEEISSLIVPELEETSPDQSTVSSERARESLLASQVKERRRTESLPEELPEGQGHPLKKKTGAGEAVLLGALASGVNRPTWFVIRVVLVALVASLFLLLHVAIQSASWFVLLNVLFLTAIAGGLILLLSWYISEIGLVSVDKQIAELNLTGESIKLESKMS